MIVLLHSTHSKDSRDFLDANKERIDKVISWYDDSEVVGREKETFLLDNPHPSAFPSIRDTENRISINGIGDISELDDAIAAIPTDVNRLVESKENKVRNFSIQKLREIGFLDLKFSNISGYVDREVTDLSSAKKVIKLIIVILVAFRNIIKE